MATTKKAAGTRTTKTGAAKKKTTGTRTGAKKKTTAAKKAPASKKKAPAKKPAVAKKKAPAKFPYKKVKLRSELDKKGFGIPAKISKAAARVRQTGDAYAAGVLRREGVKAKKARMAKGALAGAPKPRTKKVGVAKRDPNFKLTAAQKRNLSPEMQKGLVRYHRGK